MTKGGNTKNTKKKARAEVVVPGAERGRRGAKKARTVAARRGSNGVRTAQRGVSRAKAAAAQRGWRRWLLGLVALILLVAGGIAVAVCLWNNHEEPPVETVQEEATEPEEPEEEPEPEGPADGNEPLVPEVEITDWSAYQVASNKPRYLTVAEAGLYNVPVIEIGVTSAGAMDAPSDAHIVGWYYRSAYPGRVGNWATVIDGHGGALGDGVFRTLPNVSVGGEIMIEMGDGRVFTYIVTEKVLKTKGAEADAYMKVADRPVDAETPTLTLITCTGDWIRAEQTYTHRLFVRAVLKE